MEVFRLRESLLPVFDFRKCSLVRMRSRLPTRQRSLQNIRLEDRDPAQIEYILVLRSDGKRFGLLVDQVQGREEIVVKPMHAAMRQLSVFSGATLMGDGRVALIANVEGIIEHARCYATVAEEVPKSSHSRSA